MPHRVHVIVAVCAALSAAVPPSGGARERGTVGKGDAAAGHPAPSESVAPRELVLSPEQRATIRAAVARESKASGKPSKPMEDFEPFIDAELPKPLAPHPLPPALVRAIPALKPFAYVRYMRDVLIVDATTRHIVQIIPER